MKAWIPLALVFSFGLAAHANAACSYPQAPATPPNGNTATRDEMIAAKHDFDRYNTEMNAYLDCLNLEMNTAGPADAKLTGDEKKKADQEQKILVQKHNAAVDELQAVVGRFNEQLKAFKASHQ